MKLKKKVALEFIAQHQGIIINQLDGIYSIVVISLSSHLNVSSGVSIFLSGGCLVST